MRLAWGLGPGGARPSASIPLPAAGGGHGGQSEEVGSGVSSPRSGLGVQTQVLWSIACWAASGEKPQPPNSRGGIVPIFWVRTWLLESSGDLPAAPGASTDPAGAVGLGGRFLAGG